jgi:hypothetical protein
MEKDVKLWLGRLGLGGKAQAKQDAQEALRVAMLAGMSELRTANGQAIFEGVHQTAMQIGTGATQTTLNYGRRDSTTEFDLDEQRQNYRLAAKNADGQLVIEDWNKETGAQAQFQKLQAAGRMIDDMALQLQQAKVPEYDEEGNELPELDKDGNPVPALDDKGLKIPVLLDDGSPKMAPNGKDPVYKSKPKMKSLFSDDDLGNELYEPLKRMGLLPETMIPSQFSQVQKMLDGTFAAYAERLKKDEKGTLGRLFNENKALGKALLGGAVATIGVGLKMDATITTDSPDSLVSSFDVGGAVDTFRKSVTGAEGAASQADAAMGMAQQGYGLVMDVGLAGYEAGSTALADRKEAKKEARTPGREAIAARLAQTIASAAAMELGEQMAPAGVSLAASSAFGAIVQTGLLTTQLAREPDDKVVASVVDELARALHQTLLRLDPKKPGTTAPVAAAATAAQTGLKNGVDAAKVLAALKSDKPGAAQPLFEAALKTALAGALNVPLLQALKQVEYDVKARASEVLDESFGVVEEPPRELVKEHATKATGHEPIWEKAGKGWICETCRIKSAADGEDPAIFSGLLQKRIDRLKLDAALLQWGTTLGGMAMDAAATAVAPLAIAGCALKMAKNLYEAACRARDFDRFVDDHRGMVNAASVYSPSVGQFIKNSAMQGTHYSLNAAFEAVKMIGAIVQCGGVMAAPAGIAVTAGATAVQAVEQVLYEIAKRMDLEAGWDMYKKAIENPENRKAGLLALGSNPTLAKYSVAWGAVVKKDVLVNDFMDACGLDADTLRDQKANLDSVVSYLELRMPDDNVVTGRRMPTIQATLTMTAWMKQKKKILDSVEGSINSPSREVEASLGKIEGLLPILEKLAAKDGDGVSQAQQKLLLGYIGEAHGGLAAFNPSMTDPSDKSGKQVMRCPELQQLRERYQNSLRGLEKTVKTEWNVV